MGYAQITDIGHCNNIHHSSNSLASIATLIHEVPNKCFLCVGIGTWYTWIDGSCQKDTCQENQTREFKVSV